MPQWEGRKPDYSDTHKLCKLFTQFGTGFLRMDHDKFQVPAYTLFEGSIGA